MIKVFFLVTSVDHVTELLVEDCHENTFFFLQSGSAGVIFPVISDPICILSLF